jgi:CheY-like chemotaxis protein
MAATVLVVDDDEMIREALTVILETAGYEVVCVVDGLECLEYLRTHTPPAVVLLDMMMPGLDGWGVMEERRKDLELQQAPVIIVTAVGTASEFWAVSLGAVGFMSKPIDMKRLLDMVGKQVKN